MLVDTHSHIHFRKEFPDVDAILERAKAAGVTRQIIVGCTPKDSFQALDFVKGHPKYKLWSTLGVHPHNADEWNDTLESRFEELANSEEKVVGIGEIGLDYFRNFRPRELQAGTFKAQLKLAKKLEIPAIVHVRDAWDDALRFIEEIGNSKVILHCFTGTAEQARISWQRGHHIAFSGILTYPKNEELRKIAKDAPKDLILVETDCPYLPPQLYRGKRNEPAYVVETAKVLAHVRGVSLDEIGKITTENALRLFGIS